MSTSCMLYAQVLSRQTDTLCGGWGVYTYILGIKSKPLHEMENTLSLCYVLSLALDS